MIDINISLFIQIANFLFMIIIMNVLLYKPIRNIIKQRKEKIEGFESDISGLASQAEERVKEIEARLVEARRDGFSKKDAIMNEGFQEEKNIVDAASGNAEERIEEIKAQIVGEIASAREALQAELVVFSSELAQKILGRGLS